MEERPVLATINRFAQDESGATMVEYALLVVLIGLIAATGANLLGNGLNDLFSKIGSDVNMPCAASGNALSTKRWSTSLPMRMAMIVPHWERASADSWDGR